MKLTLFWEKLKETHSVNGSLKTAWDIFPIVIPKVQGQGNKEEKKKKKEAVSVFTKLLISESA